MSFAYREELISQIPALQLLINMGYGYLTPSQVNEESRGDNLREVLLLDVLQEWLTLNNHVNYRGERHAFSDSNIAEAIRRLKACESAPHGLTFKNEEAYDLLTLGTSLEQTIDGDKKSYSLKYIDWHNPANNVYHVTDELTVRRQGSQSMRRPDIVLFVNGIPLVVIECKRPDKGDGVKSSIIEGISQNLRNQQKEEIEHLFVYSQILMSVNTNAAMYATTGTPEKFWSIWQEDPHDGMVDLEAQTAAVINQRMGKEDYERLYSWRKYSGAIKGHFARMGDRLPTPQDRTIYALLRPKRLLELVYQFIVYDGGIKKIARYQQYFAVKATVERVAHLNNSGTRNGGVIWHTTGSGKSLTMVMLSKALTLIPSINNPRVVIVTDRISLDKQIWDTFKSSGKKVKQAKSGKDLVKHINDPKVAIITTVINKFQTAAANKVKQKSSDIFILVDESHRSQYGTSNVKMRQVFPDACYIGFTGTPLTKKEKSTAAKFGGFIHKYTMRQAVVDGAVVPLLYEGRIVDLDVDQAQLDRWFERHTSDLTDDEKADLKRKMSRRDEINRVEMRIEEIAYNIAEHYEKNIKPEGFKAMVATPSKSIALLYKSFFDHGGLVTSEVVVSPPDTREGHEEVENYVQNAIETHWKRVIDRYGTESNFMKEIVADFKDPEGVDLLIVVDKLLVGFDEPRNRVLYIDKPLKDHSLLQAIARVNRLFEGKDAGLIVDYRGVLGELNAAMQVYDALADFDPEDVMDTIMDISLEINKLPQLFSDLEAIFDPVENKNDLEAMQRYLEPEDIRHRFYDALTAFSKALKTALGSTQFYSAVSATQIAKYKKKLAYYHDLRMAVKQRFYEAVDYDEYEEKIRQIMGKHIKAESISVITEMVDIFDEEAFQKELERVVGAAAQADTILHRMKRTAIEKMDEDPAFYRKFSEIIDEIIEDYRQGRIDELEYLQRANERRKQMIDGSYTAFPAKLRDYQDAPAYYNAYQVELVEEESALDDNQVADLAIETEESLEPLKIIDWAHSIDQKNKMKRKIDDILYDFVKEHQLGIGDERLTWLVNEITRITEARDR